MPIEIHPLLSNTQCCKIDVFCVVNVLLFLTYLAEGRILFISQALEISNVADPCYLCSFLLAMK
jgi:hypothetical protein